MKLEIFEKTYNIPKGVLFERDLTTQFPPQTYEFMWKKLIRPGSVVFDIGAYIGLISLHFIELGAEVYAFEGSERNIPRLEIMAKEFGIKVHGVALSDIDETKVVRFNDCIDRDHPTQKVKFVKYDEYAKEIKLPKPDFVKIDIEGMETIALKQMSELIWEVKPKWQIEFHGGIPFKYEGYPGYVPVEEGGYDFSDFEKAGYQILDSFGKKTKQNKMKCFENYFFVPARLL